MAASNPTNHDYQDFAHTGPGTLAGQLARKYWHPVCASTDVAAAWAKPMRIMSEDFTLYRGETGAFHAVGFRCAHRGTQLSTGWVEGDCIRCRYHGWKFDAAGQCVEQPMEDDAFASRVRIRSYPVEEYLGLIFVFLGEGEPPPLPRYPALEQEGVREIEIVTRACNWVANLENDPGHGPFTHHPRGLPKGVFYFPKVTVEETDYGIRRYDRFPNGEFRISHRGFPNTGYHRTPPSDPESGWKTTYLCWVPIDDSNHLQIQSHLVHVTGDAARRYQEARRAWYEGGGKDADPQLARDVLAGTYRLEDLERERTEVNMTNVQDDVTQIGQGVIRRFEDERLGQADSYMLLVRRIWRRELRALDEGRPLKQWTNPSAETITNGSEVGRVPRGSTVGAEATPGS